MRKGYAAKSFSDSDEFDENADPISNNLPPFPNSPGKKNYKSIQKPIYEKQLCSPVVSSQKCLFNSEPVTVSTPSQKIKKCLGTFNYDSISPLPSTSSDSSRC